MLLTIHYLAARAAQAVCRGAGLASGCGLPHLPGAGWGWVCSVLPM